MHPFIISISVGSFLVAGTLFYVFYTPAIHDRVKKFQKKQTRRVKKWLRKRHESVLAWFSHVRNGVCSLMEQALDKGIALFEARNQVKRDIAEAERKRVDRERVLAKTTDLNHQCPSCGHRPVACPCGVEHKPNLVTWVPKLKLIVFKCAIDGAEFGIAPLFNPKDWDLSSQEDAANTRMETEIQRRMQGDLIIDQKKAPLVPKIGDKVGGEMVN